MRTTIAVEFPSPEAALEWWDIQVGAGLMPDDTEPFEADALDVEGRRASPGHYYVRDVTERPESHTLRRLVEAREQAAAAGGEKARAKVRRPR